MGVEEHQGAELFFFLNQNLPEGVTSDLKEEMQNALKLPHMVRGLCLEHKPFRLRKETVNERLKQRQWQRG